MGIDVMDTFPFLLADDFPCMLTGPITEIAFASAISVSGVGRSSGTMFSIRFFVSFATQSLIAFRAWL